MGCGALIISTHRLKISPTASTQIFGFNFYQTGFGCSRNGSEIIGLLSPALSSFEGGEGESGIGVRMCHIPNEKISPRLHEHAEGAAQMLGMRERLELPHLFRAELGELILFHRRR